MFLILPPFLSVLYFVCLIIPPPHLAVCLSNSHYLGVFLICIRGEAVLTKRAPFYRRKVSLCISDECCFFIVWSVPSPFICVSIQIWKGALLLSQNYAFSFLWIPLFPNYKWQCLFMMISPFHIKLLTEKLIEIIPWSQSCNWTEMDYINNHARV